MQDTHQVLLLTTDQQTEREVRDLLSQDSSFVLTQVCETLPDLAERLESVDAAEVIVDGGGEPHAMLGDLEKIIEDFPDTRVIVLCGTLTQECVFEAMEVGVRYVLPKDNLGGDVLLEELRRLIPNQGRPQRGLAITVLSGSGGAGATTVACNLANELGIKCGQPALYVDMDWYFNGGTSYLGLANQYGIADILGRDSIDEHLVRSSTVTYSDNLHALTSPGTIPRNGEGAMPVERLKDVLTILKRVYPYTVIDAPRFPQNVMAALGKASAMVLIVFQLSVKDIDSVRRLRDSVIDYGVRRDKIQLLVNQCRWHNPLSIGEAEQALEVDDLPYIKDDYKNAIRSLNYGELLAKSASRCKLRKGIRQWADDIEKKRETYLKRGQDERKFI